MFFYHPTTEIKLQTQFQKLEITMQIYDYKTHSSSNFEALQIKFKYISEISINILGKLIITVTSILQENLFG